MCVCGTHVQGPSYYRPPPPPPPVLVSLPQRLWVTGEGAGSLLVSPRPYIPARVSHGPDPSKYYTASVMFDGPPLTIGGTPLQVRGSRRQCSGRQQRWVGGWGGGEPERGGMSGGEGGGESYVRVSFWLPSSLEKKLWDCYTWNLHTHTTLPGMLQLLHAYDP